MQAPQETQSLSSTSQMEPEAVTVSCDSSVDGPAGRAVRLADRFRHVLGIVRRPAQEDAFRGEIDRPQFYVGFLEEAVRVQRHLEQSGDSSWLARRGNDRGGQRERDRHRGRASGPESDRSRSPSESAGHPPRRLPPTGLSSGS